MKKIFFCFCVIFGIFILFMFIHSLCRNDDYDINKEKNVLRSDLLIVLKRTVPDYILKNPNINDKDFSLFTTKIYNQKKIQILNDLSIWKTYLSGELSNDPVAVYIKYKSGVIGYRFSGKFDESIKSEHFEKSND